MAIHSLDVVGGYLRRAQDQILGQIGALLDRAIQTGEDAALTAKKVAHYGNVWFANRRGQAGELLRVGREGAVKSWPGEAGMSTAQARRLMMHETSVAHGESVVRAASSDETLGVRWLLSPGHPAPDDCDRSASDDDGYGPGVYQSDAVPSYPKHIGCLCVLSVVPLMTRR